MSYYKVLGVPRDASFTVIRQAYLQKAKRYHPDVNQSPQAEKLFKAIQEAYQTLSDEAKRRQYEVEQPGRTPTSETAAAPTTKEQRPQRTHRYRGQTYDPQKERINFSKDFFEQAEALRRETESTQSDTASFRNHIRRACKRLLWRLTPFVVIPLGLYGTFQLWRSRQRESYRSPIVHDMYGRAYLIDEFGRRTRTPRYDNKERLAQWANRDLQPPEDDGTKQPVEVIAKEPNVPRLVFDSLDRIQATKKKLTDGLSEASVHRGCQREAVDCT